MGTLKPSGFWRIGQSQQCTKVATVARILHTVMTLKDQANAVLAEGEQASLWILKKDSFNLI
jgi:hypothetical protein